MIITQESHPQAFRNGLRAGVPIGLGYFAVSFAFGLMAADGGMHPLHAALMSLTNVTSAGQFAGLNIILASGSLAELALTQLIINLRYALMSFSLSQKIDKSATLLQRLIVSFGVTDEIFAVTAAQEGAFSPRFSYGAMCVAIPGWVSGTLAGALLGNILPDVLLRALSVALYGMFLAIIIPPAREHKNVACAVILAMALSAALTYAPYVKEISSGFRIILVTLIVSALAAYVAPVREGV